MIKRIKRQGIFYIWNPSFNSFITGSNTYWLSLSALFILINFVALCPAVHCVHYEHVCLGFQFHPVRWRRREGRRWRGTESAGTATGKHHLSATLLIQRNYSAQLVKPASLSLWSSHQRSISGRELWCGMVNARAVHHQRKRPFREMKELRTNRGPDVTCLRLIEFLSTYAWESGTRRCYWGVFTLNTHTNGLLG